MRFNESALKNIAKLPEVQKEGRLNYKAPKEVFPADQGRKHVLSGANEQQCQDWVSVLHVCRYGLMKAQLEDLRRKVYEKTGRDLIAEDIERRVPKVGAVAAATNSLQRASAPPSKFHTITREGAIIRKVKSSVPREVAAKSTFFSDWQEFK